MTRQQLADDLRAMVMDDPVPFTFDGSIYIGCWGGETKRKTLEIGGYDLQVDAVLVIPLLDKYGNVTFSSRPGLKSVITINNQEYSVERTEVDAMQSSIQMDLVLL